MFCKPPCPDEDDLASVPDGTNTRPGAERSRPAGLPEVFGRLIAPEAAGPERGLPPVAVRTG